MKIRRIRIELPASARGMAGHEARRLAEAVARSLSRHEAAPSHVNVNVEGQGRSGAALSSAVGSAVTTQLDSKRGA